MPVQGDPGLALVEQAKQADLVVLGVGDTWIRDTGSLGGLREAVAARSTAPLIIVRRHGQSRLRRQREWIVDVTSEDERVDTEDPLASHLQWAGTPGVTPVTPVRRWAGRHRGGP